MSDSEGKSDLPNTSADETAAANASATAPKSIGAIAAEGAPDASLEAATSHPMSEMTGAAAASHSDATAKPELSTARTAGSGPSKAEAKPSETGPSETKAAEAASTSITILPPLRDFGGRPSDNAGPEASPKTWPLTGAQMRQWALAAAAVIMTIGVAGAFVAAGMAHFGDGKASTTSASLASENAVLKQTVAKLGTDVTELRTALDRATKANTTQIGRVTERLDKVEKAQAEPNARLAKLSETVERLSAAPKAQAAASSQVQPATPERTAEKAADKIAAATAADARNADVTGSVPAPVQATAAVPEAKKPPIIEGWTIRNVGDGGALIQGPLGLFDVFPGDPLPGLNRVEAIRREGGRWVVVTRKGWIVAR